jgi:hypothetical protein
MTRLSRAFALVVAAALLPALASATPITYVATLQDGVTETGVNSQAPGGQVDPEGAVYYRFFADAGSLVDIFADRLVGHYDPAFWIFQGLFADTAAFGGSFDAGDPGFIDFGDDEDAPNVAGPFGDPHSVFVAPVSGWYTVAVVNFASSAGPPNPFEITATGIENVNVPEPGTVLLLGAGLAGLAVLRRRS